MDLRLRVRGALFTLLPLLGCSASEPLPARLDSIEANCVVIVIDATAARHLGSYGYDRDTTPRLDALARRGVLFERTYAQAPTTIVSVPSYLTGLHPHSIAVRRHEHTAASLRYLPQVFARAGFRTAGFSGNPNVGMSMPVDDVFDHYRGSATAGRRRPVPGEELVREALAWIDEGGGDRFFLYLHLLPPHGPYLPPPEYARFGGDYRGDLVPDSRVLAAIDRGQRALTREEADFVVAQYDGNLRYADALVGRLLDGLTERGLLERSVVVVTSDHGEAFGQHGRWVHNTTLYDEMIQVPWIVWFPGRVGVPPRRVRERVALVDLAPTLEALFGLPGDLAGQAEGASLEEVFGERAVEPPPRLLFSQGRDLVAAIRDDHKLILRAHGALFSEELYDLADDPLETRDLAGAGASVGGLRQELRQAVTGFLDGRVEEQMSLEAVARELTEETELQLRALGYLVPEEIRRRRPGAAP